VPLVEQELLTLSGESEITPGFPTTIRSQPQEEFEDTKGVIKICKSKKDRQCNAQKKKNKRTNNDLQNTTQKTKDQVTRILLKTRGKPYDHGNDGP
jgi:hypothetical protein